jgi:hypothetical protein
MLLYVTGHENQQILEGHNVDEPFDIISIDVWHPGKTTTDTKKLSGDRYQKAILTSTCNLTGFASLAFISTLEAEVVKKKPPVCITRVNCGYWPCANTML